MTEERPAFPERCLNQWGQDTWMPEVEELGAEIRRCWAEIKEMAEKLGRTQARLEELLERTGEEE